MTNNAPSLQVALVDHAAIVKVNGRANFNTSVSFKRLITELKDRGFDQFLVDLSDCVTMDSTFLGVLAGTAVRLCEVPGSRINPPAEDQSRSGLRLLNPNQRVAELLENLGIADLFRTVHCHTQAVPDQYLVSPETVRPSQEELSRTCLEAHLTLMDLNPDNVTKFKDVTQFLAEDLKKLAPERQPARSGKDTPDAVPH
jgi:anti-anti-sigma regulatory factor